MLAITGPTGVGKSETAFRIAEGALAKQNRVGKSAKYLPSGLLQIRGEDYSEGSLEDVRYTSIQKIIHYSYSFSLLLDS